MVQAGSSHDITIANSNGTTNKRGFMLGQQNGKRAFVVSDYRTIVPRQLTMGELTAAEFPVEVELSWTQENWQAGMGLVNHRLGLGQYGIGKGYKVDTTSPSGIIQLARDVISTTYTGGATTDEPSGFAIVGTEVWGFRGIKVYSWDYTNKTFTVGTTPGNAGNLHRNGVAFGSNTYAPGWGFKSDGSQTLNTPVPYIYKADADANWTLSTLTTVPKFMANADDKLWGGYFATLSNAGTLNAAMDSTQTTVKFVGDTTATYINGDKVLIEGEIITLTNGGSFAGGETTYNCSRGQLGTVAVTHGAVASNEYAVSTIAIRSSTDGTNSGSWGGATNIGTADAEITGLVAYYDGSDEVLLVCKTDGLWTANGATPTVVHLYSLKAQQHIDNGRGSFAWDGNQRVIIPLGSGGMLQVYKDVVTDISFSKTMPDQTWLHGKVLCGAADATQCFVLVQETATTTYHLVMGELVSIGGSTDYRWHHVGAIVGAGDTVEEHTALLAEGVPSGANIHHRIWIVVGNPGSDVAPYFYPLTDDAEVVFTNDTDAEVQTVKWDAGLPLINKHLTKIDFTTANLGSGANDHYIEVKYRVDAGSWTYVTGAQASSKLTTSPQTLTFAVGVTGKVLELQFLLYRGTTTTTGPRILDFKVKAQLRPSALKSLLLALYLADAQMLLNGGEGGDAEGDLTQLKSWNTSADAVKVVTPDTTSYDMAFMPGYFRVTELAHELGRRREYLVECLLAEV